MMLLTAYLERAGAFERVATAALTVGRSGFGLLAALAVVAAALSAFLVNDTVCLFLTPVVVTTCRRASLPMGPFLIALATSANIGSAATLVGNPQNMIIGSHSGVAFARFALLATPAAAVGVAVNVALLWAYYGRSLPAALDVVAEPAPARRDPRPVAVVTIAVVIAFFLGFHLGFTALAGAAALMMWDREDPHVLFDRVDWPLLVFFTGLFVTVGGLAATGLVEKAAVAMLPWIGLDHPSGIAAFTALVVAGGNIVSNVPLVLLASPYMPRVGGGDSAWVLLAFAATIAGNLTLVGSVANLIVAEGAREHYSLGFREYLRFGAVSTVLVLLAGVPVLWLVGRVL
jgi:Na+/H+ antiporter NhaD/arsenite permease-like protein